jgi:pimeloyl-ACP methyl ester carboxylesterase
MGIGGNLDMWQPLQERLPGRRLIMFDFPGTGGSSLSFLPPTMGCNAVLVRLLLRRLGLGRVDVLGYSWGGVLAQHLAAQHPRTVRRLVLVATTIGIGGVPPTPRVAARLSTRRRYYSRSYFRKVAPSLYGGRYRHDPAMVETHAAQRLARPPSRLGYFAQLAALTGYSTLPGLPLIHAPTLIVAGNDDPIVPTLNPRLMARLIRHSQLAIVPDAGHLMMIDSPDIVAPIIEDFLAASD